MGLDAGKPSLGFANNKVVDQPVHQHSLISAFVILLMKSFFITSEISIFYLVSAAEQLCWNITLSQIKKTDFIAVGPNHHIYSNNKGPIKQLIRTAD